MSRTIDTRVVELEFDNRKFEENTKTSSLTLNKFKESLDFNGVAKEISITSEIITGALRNIGAKAIDMGGQIAKAITLDPIVQGLSSYESQIGSVQVIMNATGKTISEVESVMDRLVWFADETSYSMDQMSSAVSRFVSNNIELSESATAIQGIAAMSSLAGVSGQKAAIAFNNFSDAIAKGGLTAVDYKSLELAGITTTEFKETAIEAAIAVGSLGEKGQILNGSMKGTIVTIENFKETLSDQASGIWFNNKAIMTQAENFGKYATEVNRVMNEVEGIGTVSEAVAHITNELGADWESLGKKAFLAAQESKTLTDSINYTKDALASSWATTWKLIFGNYEEAKVIFTELSDLLYKVVVSGNEARNELLSMWNAAGGRDTFFEGVRAMVSSIGSVLEPIKEAFDEVFPKVTSERLLEITEKFRDLFVNFKMQESTVEKIKNSFKGLFSTISLLSNVLNTLFKISKYAFNAFGKPILGKITDAISYFGSFIGSVQETSEGLNVFEQAFQKAKDVIDAVSEKVSQGFDKIRNAIMGFKNVDFSPLETFSERTKSTFEPFTKISNFFSIAFNGLVKVIEWAVPILKTLGETIFSVFKKIGEHISNGVNNLDIGTIVDLFNSGLLAVIILKIKGFIDSIRGIADSAGGFLDGITGILDGVRGSLEAYQQSLKAKTILTIAVAIGILVASLTILAGIDKESLISALTAITTLFVELFGSMSIFSKIMNSEGFGAMKKITSSMIALSTSVLILSIAVKNLSDLNWDELFRGLTGTAALIAMLVVASKSLSSIESKMLKGSANLVVFSAAILILAKAAEKMAQLNWEELAKGLIGVGVLIAEIGIFMKITEGSGSVKTAGLLALSLSILILTKAISNLGELGTDVLAKGLIALGAIMAGLTAFIHLTKNAKGIITTATGLTILAAAMLIFAKVIEKLGSLEWMEIGKGLSTLAGTLVAVTIAVNLMPKNMVAIGIGMMALSAALLIMSNALKNFGSMSWDEIARGLVALAGSMTVIVIAMQFMTAALSGAAAMLVISASLSIMANTLQTLGGMSLAEIGKSLLALVGVFVVVGAAAAILSPLTGAILALGAGIALLGIGIAAIGVGVLAFSTGLAALAVSGTAASVAIVAIVSAILSLIPIILKVLAEGLVLAAKVIGDSAPELLAALGLLVIAALNLLDDVAPKLIDSLMNLIRLVLNALADNVPEFVYTAMMLIAGFLDGIALSIGDVVESAIKVVVQFMDGIASQIPIVVTGAMNLIVAFIDAIIDAIEEYTPILIEKVVELAGAIVSGLIKGLLNGVAQIGKTIAEIGSNIIGFFKKALDIQSPSGESEEEVGKPVMAGIEKAIKEDKKVEEAAKKKAQAIVDAFSEGLSGLSRVMERLSLELNIFEKSLGFLSSDDTYSYASREAIVNQKKLETLTQQLAHQQEKVAVTQEKYNKMLAEFGADSTYTKDAYDELRKAQYEALDMQWQIDELRYNTNKKKEDILKQGADKEAEFKQRLAETIREYQEQGRQFSLVDLQAKIAKDVGYDPEWRQKLEGVMTQAAVETGKVVSDTYQENVMTGLTGFTEDYTKTGLDYSKALGDGFVSGVPTITSGTMQAMQESLVIARQTVEDWYNVGADSIKSFAQGIIDNLEAAIAAGAEIAKAAIDAAIRVLMFGGGKEGGPPVPMGGGGGSDAIIGQMSEEQKSYAEAVANGTSDAWIAAWAEGLKAVENSEISLTVSPVLDLDELTKDIKSGVANTDIILPGTSSSIAQKAASASQQKTANQNGSDTNVNNYSFVQNNTSPKALSRIDIYRNTANQFSLAKEVVKA